MDVMITCGVTFLVVWIITRAEKKPCSPVNQCDLKMHRVCSINFHKVTPDYAVSAFNACGVGNGFCQSKRMCEDSHSLCERSVNDTSAVAEKVEVHLSAKCRNDIQGTL